MEHRIKKGRRLNRRPDQRKALLRNLILSLVLHGKLETTVAKAKEVRREFDVLVNRAKRAKQAKNFSLARKIYSFLVKKEAAGKLFNEILPVLESRRSGYLSLKRTGVLRNDGAEKAVLEIVKENYVVKEESKKPTRPTTLLSPRRLKRTPGSSRGESR